MKICVAIIIDCREYQSLVKSDTFTGEIDKCLYRQHDTDFMKFLNDFLLEVIQQSLS